MPRYVECVPKYRLHRASGLAIVTIAGHGHYLGPWKSRASRAEYDRRIGEWIANGRPSRVTSGGNDLTIVELCLDYVRFADGYYVKDGKPTGQIHRIRRALKSLRLRYGATPAVAFGPLALRALQDQLVAEGGSRSYINGLVAVVKRCFKWAAANEKLPIATYQALAVAPGLRRGRTTAREPDPIGPVADAVVDETLAHLPPIVADMVRLQRATGARPAEVCLLRPCDVDRSVDPWAFRLQRHKTEHHGRQRVVFIGPRGQNILRPYLLRDAERCCFVPAESVAARVAEMRSRRKTKVQPSQVDRRKRKPRLQPGKRYDVAAYRRAIHRACDVADRLAHKADPSISAAERIVPRWSPNRLRHSAATEIRREFGLEAAATVLGHARADVTQMYAERDLQKASSIMAKIG